MKTAEEAKSFKNWLHCLDCCYEDIKHLCKPKTKSCQPIFSYDLMMSSKIRQHDNIARQGTSEQRQNKAIAQLQGNYSRDI